MESVAFLPDADPPKFVYTKVTDDREYEQVYECEWVYAKPDGANSFRNVLVPRDSSTLPPKKVMEYAERHDIALHPESRITRMDDAEA